MSIRAMTLVWEYSRFKATRLLMLLSIADHANDDLIAWPSRRWLARKARVSERYTQDLIDQLLAARPVELKLLSAGGGRGHSPRYQIVITPHEKGLRGAGDVETHKGGGIPLPLSEIKGEAGLQQRERRASPKTVKGEAGLQQRERRASPEPLSTPTKPLTATATSAAAAAAVGGEWWCLDLLAAASKISKQGRANLLAADPSPGALVSKYLYAMTKPGINRPPLWAASQVTDNPGQWEGDPFEQLAGLGPDGLAQVLTWIRDDAQTPLGINGANGAAALAFRGELKERHRKEPARLYASVTAAIADLGLSRVALPALEPEPYEPEPAPPAPSLDAWQELLAGWRPQLAGAAYDRLLRCELVSSASGRLVLEVPTKPEFDWLSNRMGRTLAERFSADLTLREE